jgi:hypothetical protein
VKDGWEKLESGMKRASDLEVNEGGVKPETLQTLTNVLYENMLRTLKTQRLNY